MKRFVILLGVGCSATPAVEFSDAGGSTGAELEASTPAPMDAELEATSPRPMDAALEATSPGPMDAALEASTPAPMDAELEATSPAPMDAAPPDPCAGFIDHGLGCSAVGVSCDRPGIDRCECRIAPDGRAVWFCFL